MGIFTNKFKTKTMNDEQIKADRANVAKHAKIEYGCDYNEETGEETVKLGNPVWAEDYKYGGFDMMPTMNIWKDSNINAPEIDLL